MSQKIALFLALMLSGLTIGSFPQPADAKTPLTRAVIQALRNRVQLMQKSRPVRSARVSDAMAPGDALATARASLAELRFNDGSLARVGEQAVFRFVPNARTFQLSNGTMLLLIPPGRGPTGVRTPNAAAGIKGSALFVRYIPDTDTTLVGALTNNPQGPMVIYNRDASQSQGLRAGQLAVIVKNRIEQVYDFDLNTFYETSDLVKGLNLTQKDAASPSDEAIAAVRAETVEALQGQSSFKNANVIENPTFVRLPSDSTDFPVNNLDRVFNSLDVRRAVEAGEVQSGQSAASSQPNNAGSDEIPQVSGTRPTATQTPSPSTQNQNSSSGSDIIPSPPTPVGSTTLPVEDVGKIPPQGQGQTLQGGEGLRDNSLDSSGSSDLPGPPTPPPAQSDIRPEINERPGQGQTLQGGEGLRDNSLDSSGSSDLPGPPTPPPAQSDIRPEINERPGQGQAAPPPAVDQTPGGSTQVDGLIPGPILLESPLVPIDVTGPRPNPNPGSGNAPGESTPLPGSGNAPGESTPPPEGPPETGGPTRGNGGGNGNGATPATGGTPPGQGGEPPTPDNVKNGGANGGANNGGNNGAKTN